MDGVLGERRRGVSRSDVDDSWSVVCRNVVYCGLGDAPICFLRPMWTPDGYDLSILNLPALLCASYLQQCALFFLGVFANLFNAI